MFVPVCVCLCVCTVKRDVATECPRPNGTLSPTYVTHSTSLYPVPSPTPLTPSHPQMNKAIKNIFKDIKTTCTLPATNKALRHLGVEYINSVHSVLGIREHTVKARNVIERLAAQVIVLSLCLVRDLCRANRHVMPN